MGVLREHICKGPHGGGVSKWPVTAIASWVLGDKRSASHVHSQTYTTENVTFPETMYTCIVISQTPLKEFLCLQLAF